MADCKTRLEKLIFKREGYEAVLSYLSGFLTCGALFAVGLRMAKAGGAVEFVSGLALIIVASLVGLWNALSAFGSVMRALGKIYDPSSKHFKVLISLAAIQVGIAYFIVMTAINFFAA